MTDLDKLQKGAVNSYREVKRTRDMDTEFRSLKAAEPPPDFLSRLFHKLSIYFAEAGFREVEKRHAAARELLFDHEVRAALCPILLETPNADDEQLIKLFVTKVAELNTIRTTKIPVDAENLGLLSFELINLDAEDYCEQMVP